MKRPLTVLIRLLLVGSLSLPMIACSGEISVSNTSGPITGNAYAGVGPNGPYAGGSVSIHAGATTATVSGQIGTTTTTTPTTPKSKDATKTTATSTVNGTNYTGEIPNSQVPMTSGSVNYSASNVRLGSY